MDIKTLTTAIVSILIGAGLTIGITYDGENTGIGMVESFKRIDDDTVEVIRVITMRGIYPVSEFKLRLSELESKIQNETKQEAIVELEKEQALIKSRIDGAFAVGVKNATSSPIIKNEISK